MSKTNRTILGRPSDRSFAAYKAFVISVAAGLTGLSEAEVDTMTEDAWWDAYEKFWKDKATDKRPSKG